MMNDDRRSKVDYDLLNGTLSDFSNIDSKTGGKRDKEIKHVAVVGAGLVGALGASLLARRGYQVDVYEYRTDIRKQDHVQGRSINMTIARRGLRALQKIGATDSILEHTVPMYARMIHNTDGTTYPVPYGVGDQCIYSISRVLINQLLITHAEKNPNVKLHFNHKLSEVDIQKTQVTFTSTHDKTTSTKTFDTIISADGSFSKTRQAFLRDTSFCYSQTYIDALYIEMSILPDEDGKSKMPLNYLHIWPRGKFMLLGLPNQDNSWTMTLLAPISVYKIFHTEQGVIDVFQKYFPDVIPLIGKDKILADCHKAKGYPMVSIKCSPHVLNKTMLVGDAAHAMVPFYGEGMNCGFEDFSVLDNLLEELGDMGSALEAYTARRSEDVQAMCDLAMYNYIEMSDLVRSPLFKLRKNIDNLLHTITPKLWVPLYTSIRFQDKMTYSQCMKNKKWQDTVIERSLVVVIVFMLALVLGCVTVF